MRGRFTIKMSRQRMLESDKELVQQLYQQLCATNPVLRAKIDKKPLLFWDYYQKCLEAGTFAYLRSSSRYELKYVAKNIAKVWG